MTPISSGTLTVGVMDACLDIDGEVTVAEAGVLLTDVNSVELAIPDKVRKYCLFLKNLIYRCLESCVRFPLPVQPIGIEI